MVCGDRCAQQQALTVTLSENVSARDPKAFCYSKCYAHASYNHAKTHHRTLNACKISSVGKKRAHESRKHKNCTMLGKVLKMDPEHWGTYPPTPSRGRCPRFRSCLPLDCSAAQSKVLFCGQRGRGPGISGPRTGWERRRGWLRRWSESRSEGCGRTQGTARVGSLSPGISSTLVSSSSLSPCPPSSDRPLPFLSPCTAHDDPHALPRPGKSRHHPPLPASTSRLPSAHTLCILQFFIGPPVLVLKSTLSRHGSRRCPRANEAEEQKLSGPQAHQEARRSSCQATVRD